MLGTLVADLPYDKVRRVRENNRRLGLGLMGVHEWLLKRGQKYEVTEELHRWLSTWKGTSNSVSRNFADQLSISRPVANRAIAPTGTIGILASTSTGIEPVFAVAYKRRYLVDGTRWKYQYAVDHAAHTAIQETDIAPETIETAQDLGHDYERRIKFQADVQDYTDMGISSTINLPDQNSQQFSTQEFAQTLAKYAPRLRGFTCYPDGSRGGQPLTKVVYADVVERLGEEFDEHIEFNDQCNDGICSA